MIIKSVTEINMLANFKAKNSKLYIFRVLPNTKLCLYVIKVSNDKEQLDRWTLLCNWIKK